MPEPMVRVRVDELEEETDGAVTFLLFASNVPVSIAIPVAWSEPMTRLSPS